MNPEEFDKRLSESFKNEFLPPDTKLWQNIQSRVGNGTQRPFWHWLLPAIVVLAALTGWLISGIAPEKQQLTVQNNKQEVENTASSGNVNAKNSVANNYSASTKSAETENAENNASEQHSNTASSSNQQTTKGNPQYKVNYSIENPSIQSNKPERNHNNIGQLASYFQPDPIVNTEQELYPTYLKMKALSIPLVNEYTLDKENLIAYDSPFKNKKTYKSPYSKNPVDYDSKFWWSFGIGPQVNFNKAVVPSDSQAWVHKDLWSNANKMTSNGTGFHSQFLLGYKLGKYFSVESGLQYSLHSEDIKFNMTSTSIETRDSASHKITAYAENVVLWFTLPGSFDTTWYVATRGFSLAVKNRYSIVTIPVKFNFEYDLSSKTKFVAGIGAGLSAITTKKSAHLNLVEDYKEITDKKTHQFTASINAQFGFYTNFNDIGQLGIYSGFQMYTKPWELSNKQYAISMSDLQLGISFRRPLNW